MRSKDQRMSQRVLATGMASRHLAMQMPKLWKPVAVNRRIEREKPACKQAALFKESTQPKHGDEASKAVLRSVLCSACRVWRGFNTLAPRMTQLTCLL